MRRQSDQLEQPSGAPALWAALLLVVCCAGGALVALLGGTGAAAAGVARSGAWLLAGGAVLVTIAVLVLWRRRGRFKPCRRTGYAPPNCWGANGDVPRGWLRGADARSRNRRR